MSSGYEYNTRQHGPLVVDGEEVCSAEGSRQGCAWGSFTFCMGLQRTATLTQELHPTTIICMYCDDTYCVHPTDPEEAYAALTTFRRLSRERNRLESVPAKSFFYSPNPRADLSFLDVNTEGHPDHPKGGRLTCFKAVGSYIGGPTAVAKAVAKAMADQVAAASVLEYLKDTEHSKSADQCRLLTLRHCANSTPSFLLRTTPPDQSLTGARIHDAAIAECLIAQLPCPLASQDDYDRAVAQARLPPQLGGFGLTSAFDLRLPCFAGSLVSSLATASRLIPTIHDILQAQAAAPSLPSLRALNSARLTLFTMRDDVQGRWDEWDATPVYHEPVLGGPQYRYHPISLPPAHASAFQPLSDALTLPPLLLRSFQHTYMRAVHHHNWLSLMHTATNQNNNAYAANLIDVSQPGACDFLRAVPSDTTTTISSIHFSHRLLRQLRLPLHTIEDPMGMTSSMTMGAPTGTRRS